MFCSVCKTGHHGWLVVFKSLGDKSWLLCIQKFGYVKKILTVDEELAGGFQSHRTIGSMYGIYANIWGILIANVTIYIYSIRGSYGNK